MHRSFFYVSHKATVGQGAIVTGDAVTGKDSLAGVNRDALNTETIIKDVQTGGLAVDTGIDTRVLTNAGRAEIIDEQKELGKNVNTTGKITVAAGIQGVATAGNIITGNQNISQAIQGAKTPSQMAKVIQDHPEVGAVLQSYQQGDYEGLLNSQNALQILSDSTGVSVDVIITSLTNQLRAKGATDGQLVAIDSDIDNREDVINTIAHEIDHVRSGKKGSSEYLADLAGIAADLNVSASIDANQDKIDSYKHALGNGKDAATQLENEQLLGQNDETLAYNLADNPDGFDYRQLHPEKGEYWVVDQLYKAQGNKKKWTREQIANALRSADFKKGSFTEDDDSNTVVNLSNGEPKNYIDYENGAKWKSTGGGLTLPVDRNIDPMLGAWIKQVMSQDQDFKSYDYKWDSQNLKGNKPLPSIVTPEKPKPKVKLKTVSQGKNPAKIVTQAELDSLNQAVINGGGGVDFRSDESINTVTKKTVNEKVMPVVQVGVGASEVLGGTAACVAGVGVGCIGGAVLIANGLDNMTTGGSNFNEKPTEQVPSAALDAAGVSKETAGLIKLGTDLVAGGVVANLTKPKPKTLAVSETKTVKVENNVNIDNNALDDSYPREEFWYKDDIYAPTVVRNPEVMNGLLRQNGIELKQDVTPQEVFENVYQTPNLSRPDPSSYLSPSYIANWNSKWDDGAVRFSNIESVEEYGTIGSKEAFVIPKSEYDNLMKKTGGDLSEVEVKLSLPKGYLTGGKVGTYHIKPQSTTNVKMPSGNERGANTQWLIGGKTANGLQEGILDLTNGNIQFEKIN